MNITKENYFKKGLIGGVIILYFSVIGMVTSFADRYLIGEIISMGHMLFYGGALWIAISLKMDYKGVSFSTAMKQGAIAGVLSFVPTFVLYLVASTVSIRDVFVNIADPLLRFLDSGYGLPGILITLLTIIILINSIISLNYINKKNSDILVSGIIWTLGIAVFSELVSQVLSKWFGRGFVRLLFFEGSFHIHIAFIVFVIAMVAKSYSQKRELIVVADISEEALKKKETTKTILIVVALIIFPWATTRFISQIAFKIGLYVLMGLGLNIVVGYAGLLDLGYVAFFAFGAYTMGLLTTTTSLVLANGQFNFWLALPIAMIIAVFFGVILGFPVLRMRGDYLAIVTLGFGEIIRILALSDWLGDWMGGAQGVLKMKTPEFFGVVMDSPETMYYVVIIGAILVGFISVRLRDSRLGRQWMAMREDEDVAEAMGINLITTKLLAFGIGAGFSGFAGAIFSARLGNIFPHSFNLIISVNVLSLIIVGGLASIPGVVVGAIVLVGLPELLREFQEYRLLLYGILLIIMMLNKPEGFVPAEIYKRELSDSPDNVGSQD